MVELLAKELLVSLIDAAFVVVGGVRVFAAPWNP